MTTYSFSHCFLKRFNILTLKNQNIIKSSMERMGTGKEENRKIGKDLWICGADAFDGQKK
jgi:hypothetical protein